MYLTRQQQDRQPSNKKENTTSNFHPSPNGVITPHHTSHQEIQLAAQQTEILRLKEEFKQVITMMKKSQLKFEKSTEEKQMKYEVKLDKVTTSMQKELTITNNNIQKIHKAVKTHVTKVFIEDRMAANTNGLIAWLQQNVVCNPQPHCAEEEPQEYMHINNQEHVKLKSIEMLLTNSNHSHINTSDEESGNAHKC
jgi:hypothetical protein